MTAVLVVGAAGGAWAWTEHDDRVAAAQAADERAVDAHQAQVRDAEALRTQTADAARVQAAAVRADARGELVAVAEHARATLAATQDAVADDAVRQQLAAELATADAALAATDPALAGPPATPSSGATPDPTPDPVASALPTGSGAPSDPASTAEASADPATDTAAVPADVGTSTAHSAVSLRALAASLALADAAVVASHDAWVQEQAAAEAARQAAAAASTKKPTTSAPAGSSAPSCETTYSGPPFYTSPATVGGDGSNGKLPPESLTAISWDVDPHGTPYYLKNAAAAALERLDGAFRAAFGHHLDLDLTYRDYDTQVAMRAALGSVAAKPGTSTHGTGLALDVPELPCEYGWDTPQRAWLVTRGPSYGWVSPSWAGRNGSNPEYWHFEFVG